MVILQDRLPAIAWMDPRTARLPGIQPVTDDSWLVVDEAFAGQMAERDRLIAEVPALVHGLQDAARPAAEELYTQVLEKLARTQGYRVGSKTVLRPDGVEVALDQSQPLLTLGRLVQEDLCLMQKQGDEHVLTGAILCFPASWTLAEKLGRAMVGIHRPVVPYDADLAKRVQRMFDMIRPEQPLWRMNANIYAAPDLFHPRREDDPRKERRDGAFMRSERQCLLRLPQTGAVLFSIHTYVVRIADLPPEAQEALALR
jgi:dimethylamine monooxygenase subunit A